MSETATIETTQHPMVGRTLVIRGKLTQAQLEEFVETYNVKIEDITPELIVQKVTEDLDEKDVVVEVI